MDENSDLGGISLRYSGYVSLLAFIIAFVLIYAAACASYTVLRSNSLQFYLNLFRLANW